jgi:hypothetical protein
MLNRLFINVYVDCDCKVKSELKKEIPLSPFFRDFISIIVIIKKDKTTI